MKNITKFDKLHNNIKYISGQLFFTNLMLVLIFLCNLGDENVIVKNTVETVETADTQAKHSNEIPILYCSSDNIFYFKDTFTVVVDNNNKPKKCQEKNKTYMYSSEYSEYRVKN